MTGTRFSLNYLARGEPLRDSERMRKRISVLFEALELESYISRQRVEYELGVDVPTDYEGVLWDQFLIEAQLRDFLDLITIASNLLAKNDDSLRRSWIAGVALIFAEENVRYKVDKDGSVHFAIDGEYERNQVSAIAALQAPRYSAARAHFEAGQKALDSSPPQTREAIRQTFEAVETIFKLLFSGVSQLGANEIARRLRPHLDATLTGTEKDSASMLIESFKSWVNSAHPYRHGQAVETPDNPTLATAVLSVSIGSSYIRWLAEIDTAAAQ